MGRKKQDIYQMALDVLVQYKVDNEMADIAEGDADVERYVSELNSALGVAIRLLQGRVNKQDELISRNKLLNQLQKCENDALRVAAQDIKSKRTQDRNDGRLQAITFVKYLVTDFPSESEERH